MRGGEQIIIKTLFMKTITIKQPWADLICSGLKDVENRTWPTKFRGRVLVHAAKKPVKDGMMALSPIQIEASTDWFVNSKLIPDFGSIIGSVEIVDCVINHSSIWAEKTHYHQTNESNPDYEDDLVIYNWVLANPILFPEPIPAKGKLSFWDYPNILAEPEEKDGELFCHCQLPVRERIQVLGDSRFGYYCRYCGGKWYK